MDELWGYVIKVVDSSSFEFEVRRVGKRNHYAYQQRERVRIRSAAVDGESDDDEHRRRRALKRRLDDEFVYLRVHTRDREGSLVADVDLEAR